MDRDLHPTLRLPRIAQTWDFTCGAACFESMYRFFKGQSLGEEYVAKLLGTFELGYTPPENIARLATVFGFYSHLKRQSDFSDIEKAIQNQDVVFVTWWDEDAGHYSLVKEINGCEITLMDPWQAREQQDKILPISEFIDYWSQRGKTIVTVALSNHELAP